MNTHDGMEYWAAMNLAGDYAKPVMRTIHRRIGKSAWATHLVNISNKSSTWQKKWLMYQSVLSIAKGATPASINTPGIIPGSMTEPGFIVIGKTMPIVSNLASHGLQEDDFLELNVGLSLHNKRSRKD